MISSTNIKIMLKIQKNKCKWLVGSVSWTSAKPNFTNCPPPYPPSIALDDLLFDEVSVKVILIGLQLKPYKASAMGIFWYKNKVKWIYISIIQCAPFVDFLDISRTHG